MLSFNVELFIVVLFFMLSLAFALKPVYRLGMINFLVGFGTIIIASTVALGITGDVSLVEQVFLLVVDVVGMYCILRADGITKVG